MISTEPGLRWRRSFETAGPRGEECIRYDCLEHPRLYQLRQRPNADAEWHTLFYVDGIATQHYADPVDALAAMRANPLPCRCDATGCAVSVGDELFEGHVCRESAP